MSSPILFLEDWLKHPGAIVDTQTKNKSFLEIAELLRLMGVKNYFFMLSLHNPKLLGVDPHDPNLTDLQRAWILKECQENFWYAVRNVWKAPGKAGQDARHIQANRANIALWWSFFNHITFILIQPRQTGKTFSTGVLMNSIMNFHTKDTQINLLTKDDTLRLDTIKTMKEIYDELPPYLNFKDMRAYGDTNNTDTVTVNRWNNVYRTHVPQSSEKRAANTGRGLSSPIFHVDEAPFQPFIEHSFPAAIAAMGSHRDLARDAGRPYGIILTTTAGKKDDRSGKFVYTYVNAAALWNEKYFDCENQEILVETVRRNSRGTVDERGKRSSVSRLYAVFNHRQLGKDDKWLREQIEETGAGPEEVERDYLCHWTSGTENSPLTTKQLEDMIKGITSPRDVEHTKQNYMIRWYVDQKALLRDKNRFIVIGCDSSEAAGDGDSITLVGTDIRTGEVVFASDVDETNLLKYCEFVADFLILHERSVFVPERRSTGVTIIDYLLSILPKHGINPFTKIFNWVMCEPDQYRDMFEQANQPPRRHTPDLYVRAKRHFGFATSGTGKTARDELYGRTLQNAAKRCAATMRDRTLIEQTTSLAIIKGRVDHQPGGHDDLVIAWLLTHWFLTSAKNLINYGIVPNEVLCDIPQEKRIMTRQEMIHEYEQQLIRQRIRSTMAMLAEEKHPLIVERLENELRQLDKRLVLSDEEHFNIDTLLDQIRQKRKTELIRKAREY